MSRYLRAGVLCMSLNLTMVRLEATEVIQETHTKVIQRENPATGKPYFSIVTAALQETEGLLPPREEKYSRPDYQMLAPESQRGEIFYDGPASSRKKVYIFAGAVATVGAVGGTLGMLSAASTATAGAAGGAGGYAAGGAAVASGAMAGALKVSSAKPQSDDFVHTSKTDLVALVDQREPETDQKVSGEPD